MALFRHRPLAAAAIALILSAAALYFLPLAAGAAFLLLALFLAVAGILWCKKQRFQGKLLVIVPLLLFVLFGTGRAFFDRLIADSIWSEHITDQIEAELVIEEISYQSTYSSEVYVRVLSVNETACRSHAVLRTSGILPFYVGDRIRGEFRCEELSFESYYQGIERTYLGNGARVILIAEQTPTLTESGADTFAAFRADLAASLSYRIRTALSGKGGELLSALLIGDRENLSEETVRDFRRIGISHLLAISGLHLSALCGTSDALLRFCRVHKRWRLLSTLLLSVLYFILTGGSVSILRAAFMFAFVQISFFLRTDNDAFTSLSLSAAILVLLTPTIIFNLSFLMTMLATFGILSFGELQKLFLGRLPHKKGIRGIPFKLLSKILTSLILTLSATLALLPVQWLIFGELSLLTPLSNLLFVPLSMPLLIAAALTLALSPFPALSRLLSLPVGLFCNLLLRLAEALSRWNCVISLKLDFVPFILIPLFLLTAILLCIDLKKRKALILGPFVTACIAFAICLGITYRGGASHFDVMYHRAGDSEGIALYQNGDGVVFDLCGGSYSQLYANYQLLSDCGAPEVDALVCTHYHSTMPTTLSKFSKAVLIRTVYLPLPATEEESLIFQQLLEVAADRRVTVVTYQHGETVSLRKDLSFVLSDRCYKDRSSEPAFALDISLFGREVRYESSSYREYQKESGGVLTPVEAVYLILGAHGPVPKQDAAVLTSALTDRILIGDRDVLDCLRWQGGGHAVLFPEFYYFRMNRP